MLKISARGRVGQDPETTTTKNGNQVTRFSLACDRRGKDAKERGPIWVRVAAWNGLEGKMPITKGTALDVEGYMDLSTYENKNGETVTQVELNAFAIDYSLSSPKRDDNGSAPSKPAKQQTQEANWGDEVEW